MVIKKWREIRGKLLEGQRDWHQSCANCDVQGHSYELLRDYNIKKPFNPKSLSKIFNKLYNIIRKLKNKLRFNSLFRDERYQKRKISFNSCREKNGFIS